MTGALIASAVIGAGSAVYSANKQSGAMDDAAATQASSEANQLALQKEMFDKQTELNQPFHDLGASAIPKLQYMATGEGDPYNFETSPLYEYQQQLGEKSINRAAAARGGYGSTATVENLGNFNLALGASEVTNQYNRLLDMVNIGRGAATQTGAASQAYGTNASAIMGNSSSNIANLQLAQGQNEASMWSEVGAMPMQAYNAYQSYQTPQPMTQQNTWLNPDTNQYVSA